MTAFKRKKSKALAHQKGPELVKIPTALQDRIKQLVSLVEMNAPPPTHDVPMLNGLAPEAMAISKVAEAVGFRRITGGGTRIDQPTDFYLILQYRPTIESPVYTLRYGDTWRVELPAEYMNSLIGRDANIILPVNQPKLDPTCLVN